MRRAAEVRWWAGGYLAGGCRGARLFGEKRSHRGSVAWRRMSGLSVRRGVFTPSMLDATKELGIQKRDISEARSSCGLQHMIPIELQKRTAYVQCSRAFRYRASILAAP